MRFRLLRLQVMLLVLCASALCFAQSGSARTGALSLLVTPGGAQVYFDDEPKGVSSQEGRLSLRGLRPGLHKVRLDLSGYQELTRSIRIVAGQTYYLKGEFQPVGAAAPAPATAASSPSSSLPVDAQAAFDKGVLAAKQQDFVLAGRYFDEARKAAPESLDPLFNLALAESKVPGREVRSMAWFEAYLAANPQAANAKQVREQMNALQVRTESAVSKLLASARQMANQYTDNRERLWKLTDVAYYQALSGDVVGAKQLADTLQEMRFQGLLRITRAQVEKGDLAGAMQTIQSTPPEIDNRPSTSLFLIEALAKNGDARRAEVAYADVSSKDLCFLKGGAGGLVAVGNAYSNSGDKSTAYAKYKQALEVVKRCPRPAAAVFQGYYEVFFAQAIAGDESGALATLSLVPVSQESDMFVTSTARRQLEAGDFRGAWATAQHLSPSGGAANKALLDQIEQQKAAVAPAPRSTKEPLPALAYCRISKDYCSPRVWRVTPWSFLVEHDLSEPVFLDLPGHIQTVSSQSNPNLILIGMFQAIKALVEAEQKIKKLESEQDEPQNSRES